MTPSLRPSGQADPAAQGGVLACSLRQAQQRLGDSPAARAASAPDAARRLRAAGAKAVCIVGVTGPQGHPLHWLDCEQARGWLAPTTAASPGAGSARFAQQLAAAMARGFVVADAAVLATMATSHPRADRALAPSDFVNDPALLPRLSWGEAPHFAETPAADAAPRPLGLYAIVDSAERLVQVLAAGVRTVQLRIKTPRAADAPWRALLRQQLQRAIAACQDAGAELFINDHWQLAIELGAGGVHLGQEDLLALDESGRSALKASGLALGISSHSLWELCRARALAPRYIACGPVWPTETKAMPWRPQGLDNLAWWCRMARAPVVAIGGVLGAEQVREAARCGADGVCIVRGLGSHPERVLPAFQAALEAGRTEHAAAPIPPAGPHPSLAPAHCP